MIKGDELKEYGKVEICDEVNNTFHIKITEGFNNNLNNVVEVINVINNKIGNKYPIIKKVITDKNLLECILEGKE